MGAKPTYFARLYPSGTSAANPTQLTRKPIYFGNLFQTRVPLRPACKADMRVWSDVDCAIKTSGRHNQQSTLHLNTRKSRPTFSAKASFMSGRRNSVGLDAVMPRQPSYRRR